MGKALEDFEIQVASQAAGGVLGLALGKINDSRQREQQQHLQDMQIRGQKEMTEYNRQKQMQMWRDTNYSAQVEQLKLAGLNPGLIYGMSGGGGVTAGVTGGNVTGASAPQGGGEAQAMAGMGIQSALLGAQLRNIEAQTEKTKAETANVPLTGQQTQASTALTKINTRIAQIEAEIKGATIEEAINKVTAEMATAQQQVMQEEVKTEIDRATKNDTIDTVKANLAGILLKNALTKTQNESEKQKIQNAITQLDLMKDQLYKTNPEQRKMLSTQMQAIWRTIEHSKDDNDGGEKFIDAILKIIP